MAQPMITPRLGSSNQSAAVAPITSAQSRPLKAPTANSLVSR